MRHLHSFKFYCFFIVLLSIHLTAYPQHQTINLNWEQGMQCGMVTDIVQDKKGCIWMATDGGLHRWDGYRFTVYDTTNSPISQNELNTVLLGDDGITIWIGTRGEGLCKFNPETDEWTVMKKKDGLLSNGVTRLTHATDGGIWVICYLKGVSHLSKDGHLTHYSSKNVKGLEPPNWTALDDGKGHLYIGHLHSGLSVIDLATKKLLNYRLISKEEPFGDGTRVPRDNEIFSLCWDQDSLLWCGTYYSLFAYSPRDSLFVKHIPTRSLVLSIICDKNNELLYGESDEGGFGLLKDHQGNIWKSNNETGVTVTCHTRPLFSSGDYHSEDIKYPGIVFVCDTTSVGGKTYIASVSGIWEKREDGSIVERKDINEQLNADLVYGVVIDDQGNIWAGTFGNGLHVFQPDGKKIASFENEPSAEIIQLMIDSKGRVWMASHNGLSVFSSTKTPKLIHTYTRSDGLPNNMIWGLCEDHKGRIWMSSNNGITCLFPETGQIRNFTYSDGIPSRKFRYRNARMLPNGQMCFEQEQGACVFDPDEVLQDRRLSNCFISSLTIISDNFDSQTEKLRTISLNNATYSKNNHLTFSHNENSFIVSLGVEDIAQAQSVEFQYKLEGRDDRWYDVGLERNITLHYIHPGKYQLKIRARLEDGEWNETICQPLSFTVSQPWWWTWWMRTLYITLIVAFLLWQLQQYRQRQMIKRLQTGRLAVMYASNKSEDAINTHVPEQTDEDETESESEDLEDSVEVSNAELRQLDKEFLKQLDTIIQEHLLDENLDTKILTEQMCVSYSVLYRKLKDLTDMNVTEYIRKHRLTKALQLLNDGYNVNETMVRCGFYSRSYFRKCFKEEFGVLPSKI